MKKRNKVIGALVAPIIASSMPLIATSCAKQEEDLVTAIYKSALNHFYDITCIPHISNVKQDEQGIPHLDSLIGISNYVRNVAGQVIEKDKIFTDRAGNIWYDIPASDDADNYKPLILQSHLDMVWAAQGEANKWNKWTHPVAQPVIEKVTREGKTYDVMHSKDFLTNLGVDNGNGVAEMLAITEYANSFKHGLIRCIYTVNEEGGGCEGAEALGKMADGSEINVINHEEGFDWLINVDGNMGFNRADVIFCSAGGFRVQWNVNDLETQTVTNKVFKITLSGCKGGHSGLNINDELANPLNLLAYVIQQSSTLFQAIHLCDIDTDSNSDTSIPHGATFTVELADGSTSYILNELLPIFNTLKEDFKGESSDMKLEASEVTTDLPTLSCSSEATSCIIWFLKDMPYGPLGGFYEDTKEDPKDIKWSCNTGLCDLILTNETKKFSISAMARVQEEEFDQQAKDKYNEEINKAIINFKNSSCGTPDETGYIKPGFKGWKQEPNSWICQTCTNIYESLGFKPHNRRIHGGLECGDFILMNPNLQQISIGPLNEAEHGVQENLYLLSYEGVIASLLKFIEVMDMAE